jgi:hypothetical protein
MFSLTGEHLFLSRLLTQFCKGCSSPKLQPRPKTRRFLVQ